MTTTRRSFVQAGSMAAAAAFCAPRRLLGAEEAPAPLLQEFPYSDVELLPGLAQTQFEQTQSVLMALNEDSLLKPWRQRAGLPAPGPDLGGWYDELPLDATPSGGHGFAPAHSFGQWISALSRGYAITGDARTRAHVQQLLGLYGAAISGRFYTNFRFPAYNYDKMMIGLIDAHQFVGLPEAFPLLERTTDAAEPHLPPQALDRDEPQRKWRAAVGDSTEDNYTWDESYTLPENLFLAAERGAGERYRRLAPRFLLDQTYFDPLSENSNVLAGHHAYSFCNALSSAAQAYIGGGSAKHLRAATNAFEMITATQSFATGGWGPDESFSLPGSSAMYDSLSATHRSFETPCGSYAHFKLSRYLLRITRDGRYGDSMERVLYNTVLGAKPLEADGHAFYYSDYNGSGNKSYFADAFPCCSGTLPQVAADYRLLPYFRDGGDVYVNLYMPSSVKWTGANGAQLKLTQTTEYPVEGTIRMDLRASRKEQFALRLRIPAWASPAGSAPVVIRVNGHPTVAPVSSGFATVRRKWHDGDRVELDLLLPLRLEAIDPEHPEMVALVRGPLVLFPVGEDAPSFTPEQLLGSSRIPGQSAWQAQAAAGPVTLLPFTQIAGQRYRTYMEVG